MVVFAAVGQAVARCVFAFVLAGLVLAFAGRVVVAAVVVAVVGLVGPIGLVFHRLLLGLLLGDELLVGRQNQQLERLRPRQLSLIVLVVARFEVAAQALPLPSQLFHRRGVADVPRRRARSSELTQVDPLDLAGVHLADHQREFRQPILVRRLAGDAQRLVDGQLDLAAGLGELDHRRPIGQHADGEPRVPVVLHQGVGALVDHAITVVFGDAEFGLHAMPVDTHQPGPAVLEAELGALQLVIGHRHQRNARARQGLDRAGLEGLGAFAGIGGPMQRRAQLRDGRRLEHLEHAAPAGVAGDDLEPHRLSVHRRGAGPGDHEFLAAAHLSPGGLHHEYVVVQQAIGAVAVDLHNDVAVLALLDGRPERHRPAGKHFRPAGRRDMHNTRDGRGGDLIVPQRHPRHRRPNRLVREQAVAAEQDDRHEADNSHQPNAPGVHAGLHFHFRHFPGGAAFDRLQRAGPHARVALQLKGADQVVAELRVRPLNQPGHVEIVDLPDQRNHHQRSQQSQLGEHEQPAQHHRHRRREPAGHEMVGRHHHQQERRRRCDHRQHRGGSADQPDPPFRHPKGVLDEQFAVRLAQAAGHGVLPVCAHRSPVHSTAIYDEYP